MSFADTSKVRCIMLSIKLLCRKFPVKLTRATCSGMSAILLRVSFTCGISTCSPTPKMIKFNEICTLIYEGVK